MQQYFSEKRENDILYLDERDIHHIKNVMRMKVNDKVLVCYDGVLYLCSLNLGYNSVSIKSVEKSDTENLEIVAYIPVLNDEKMSFIIEKGTEMGVSKFIPVRFNHCKFVMSREKELKKLERYNKIAKEASEQARRLIIPVVEKFIDVDNVDMISGVNILCSADKHGVKPVKEVLNLSNMCDRISLVFGPEGGLSSKEEEILENKGFIKTTLGNNILRTETVIINVCSIINYLNG